jgi:hypothetical protein
MAANKSREFDQFLLRQKPMPASVVIDDGQSLEAGLTPAQSC